MFAVENIFLKTFFSQIVVLESAAKINESTSRLIINHRSLNSHIIHMVVQVNPIIYRV